MLRNFSFVLDGVLAGSAMPGVWSPLVDDLADANRKGITAIVTLTEERLFRPAIEEAGIRYLHIPIEDFAPPTISQVEEFIRFVDEERARGGAVLAHCFAGMGRTGTMLAAYLVKEGLDGREAVRRVRELRPGSIETRDQANLVLEYEGKVRR